MIEKLYIKIQTRISRSIRKLQKINLVWFISLILRNIVRLIFHWFWSRSPPHSSSSSKPDQVGSENQLAIPTASLTSTYSGENRRRTRLYLRWLKHRTRPYNLYYFNICRPRLYEEIIKTLSNLKPGGQENPATLMADDECDKERNTDEYEDMNISEIEWAVNPCIGEWMRLTDQ